MVPHNHIVAHSDTMLKKRQFSSHPFVDLWISAVAEGCAEAAVADLQSSLAMLAEPKTQDIDRNRESTHIS